MTGAISSINMGLTPSISLSSSSSAQKLTDATKNQLQLLGIDTTKITTEAQGQTILSQALQAQQSLQPQVQQTQNITNSKNNSNDEIKSLKEQAIELSGKVGVTVSQNERLSDIIATLGPAIESKISAAGSDQTKIAEAQELEAEYDLISSSLTKIQTQSQQSKQSSQTLNTSLNNMAMLNIIFHKL